MIFDAHTQSIDKYRRQHGSLVEIALYKTLYSASHPPTTPCNTFNNAEIFIHGALKLIRH